MTEKDEVTLEEFTELEESDNFRLANQKILLTYKTHINKENLISFIKDKVKNQCPSPKFIRCAHEIGKSKGINYDHTHVLIDFGKSCQSKSSRLFDYKPSYENTDVKTNCVLHPNIRKIVNVKHWNRALRYIAKDDPDNHDLKTTPDTPTYNIADIWAKPSMHEALLSVNKLSLATNVIAAYNSKPSKPTPLEGKLKPWQNVVLGLTKKPVGRNVIWIYDQTGNSGKSWFLKYCITNFPEKYTAIVQASNQYHTSTIMKNILDSGWNGDTIIIDIPRSADFSSIYTSIEDFKNGIITSVKYNGKTMIFNPCHVIVMCNFPPNEACLSKDRWQIIDLNSFDIDKWMNEPLSNQMVPIPSPSVLEDTK